MDTKIKEITTPFKLLTLIALLGSLVILIAYCEYNFKNYTKMSMLVNASYNNLELICLYKNCLYTRYGSRYYISDEYNDGVEWRYGLVNPDSLRYKTVYEEYLSTTTKIPNTNIVVKYINWEMWSEYAILIGFFIVVLSILLVGYYIEHKFIKISEAELKEVKEKSNLETDLRMVIAATAHHEMLTPIAVMRISVNKLRNSDIYIDNEHIETFNILCSTINRLESVINQMSSVRRLYKKQKTSMTTIIRTTVSSLQVIFTEYNFKYTINNQDILDSVSNYKLECGTVSNILNNLFKNSLEAGADIINIVAGINNDKTILSLIVMDNGTGVPKINNKLVDIFKLGCSSKESKIDAIKANTDLKAEECRGNGLYLVKTILNSAGGDIVLVETSVAGTVFKLTIPCKVIGE